MGGGIERGGDTEKGGFIERGGDTEMGGGTEKRRGTEKGGGNKWKMNGGTEKRGKGALNRRHWRSRRCELTIQGFSESSSLNISVKGDMACSNKQHYVSDLCVYTDWLLR